MSSRFQGIFGRFLVVAMCATFLTGAGTTSSETASASPGDLIRGSTYSTVYYLGADGLRYVFPNEKTYRTWYSGWNDITNIGDVALGQIQMGGNVTYKPGVKLVKINTDPRTYTVEEGGVLRWVENETLARSLYGDEWNKNVDDIPDAFFANYDIGRPIDKTSDYVLGEILANTADIGDDKDIITPAVISITGTTYSPIDVVIIPGSSVRFTNDDIVQHTVTADDLTWGSGTLAPGAEFVHTFPSAGTYPFFDSYNSRLTGAVYVQTNI